MNGKQQNDIHSINDNSLDLREEIAKYLRYWPWFIITCLLFIIIAKIYLRYATAIYQTTSTVLIKDTQQSSEASAFSELGFLGNLGSTGIANEIGILKSRRLMQNVVESLRINITYYGEGSLKDIELYKNTPFLIKTIEIDEEELRSTSKDKRSFRISKVPKSDNIILQDLSGKIIVKTGLDKLINYSFGSFVITKNPDVSLTDNSSVLVTFNDSESVANSYRGRLGIVTLEKSSIIEMSMKDPVLLKAQNILDQLVVEFNADVIADKNLIANNTKNFIEERIVLLSKDLDDVESDIEVFKEDNKLIDIQSESQILTNNANQFKQEIENYRIQLELAEMLLEYVDNGNLESTIPANIGIAESNINSAILNFNQTLLERNRLLRSSTNENPVVRDLNANLEILKREISSNLKNSINGLKVNLKNLYTQAGKVESRIFSVPNQEREFRAIERQQNIKEALYLFLLQKREESVLSLAIAPPKAKVVDSAYGGGIVSPNSGSILLGALLSGLLLPFGFIYFKRLLNNKIERREDIEKVTKSIPIVGELPRIAKGESDLIVENDRSVLAESFRILTTNLQYLLVNAKNDDRGYCIYTTSTVKGEGKTFTSINLALTIANTGKKVVLIGADLRNPQLQRYDTGSKSLLGVSDYLVNNDHDLNDLVHDSKFHDNLKLFLSGSIPPNPSELLRQSKFGTMLKELQAKFDYVIVDTAPSMLVTDTFLISKHADLILYVTRAGYTEKRLLQFAVDSTNEGKLHDVSFVINDVKNANFGYGNKYGYAYGQTQPSLWERFKNSF
ncbi:GumC family protein [Leeuwenhoekiella sp. LLG6367-2.1]|uniref:GumC family protein n=1 Tax=Leeuwenhoekiella sp. LLG6367-2.1 TaxID=3160833 RepID=UPI00386CF157